MPCEIHLIISDSTSRDFFRKLNELIDISTEDILYLMTRPVQYQVPAITIQVDDKVSENPSNTDVTSLSIRNLGLHARTVGALKWAYSRGYAKSEIETIGDLLEYSAEDLLAVPQFGHVSLRDLRVALAKYGLHLMLEEVYPLEGE